MLSPPILLATPVATQAAMNAASNATAATKPKMKPSFLFFKISRTRQNKVQVYVYSLFQLKLNNLMFMNYSANSVQS